jgi:4a-hydroxytetrahydrobiopterin dehydratase
MTEDLTTKRCLPCEGGVPVLSKEKVTELLSKLDNWEFDELHPALKKTLTFKNFYETMAYVNALAYIAHQENHHPDLEIGYNYCKVRYSTHAVGGLTENDFICAAIIDKMRETSS